MKKKKFLWKNITINYYENGKGKPLVLIHAFPFSASIFQHQIKYLSNYHTIAPDLPGFGKSPPLEKDTPFTMENMADMIASLCDHLNFEKIALLGVSMGGYISLAFANQYSSRLSALIISNSKATADTTEKVEERKITAKNVVIEGSSILLGMIPKLLSNSTVKNNPTIVYNIKNKILTTNTNSIASALLGMASRKDMNHILAKLKIPILIITGNEDTIITTEDINSMASFAKQAIIIKIKNGSHLSNIDNPDEYNKAIIDFLN